jgi:hypothetical protein
MVGISPAACLECDDTLNELEQKLRPWLGNFMKDKSLHTTDGYNQDQWLDVIVQSCQQVKPEGETAMLHYLRNCALTRSILT